MKPLIGLIFCVLFLGVKSSFSQVEKNYDSISIYQKNSNRLRFEFQPEILKNASIHQSKPKRTTYSAGEVLEDVGRVGLTLLLDAFWGEHTDTSIDDTDEVEWVLSSHLNCDVSNYNWDFQIFTKGIHYKEFNASGSELGSNSEREVWWDNSTTGLILHQKDTISRFVLLVKPDINSIIEKMDPDNFEDRKVGIMNELNNAFQQGSLFLWYIDYAVIGTFRGENFSVICSEQAGKFWIFIDGKPKAILQESQNFIFPLSKKSEERQLLIAKENKNNSLDLLRLSMLYYYFRSNNLDNL